MRNAVMILLAAAIPAGAQQQQSAVTNPAVNAAKGNWMQVQDYLVRSAEQMPESLYSFKPTPSVRSFGQIIGHVAGSQFMFCAAILGEKTRAEDEFEKGTMTKTELVKAIKESGAYCDRAYSLGDADGNAKVALFGTTASKLSWLISNAGHDMEHYGNLVTYFRISGMTPPSSQGQ
ncbi:MAG TPA: DinB family protein [Gemmatimonadaceae bacterium]|nr:DinB family protein [Gemmatimonadaceae bacterium]